MDTQWRLVSFVRRERSSEVAIRGNDRPSHGSTGDLIVMLTADIKVDRRILLEADSLESRGWRVKIIAMSSGLNAPDDDGRILRISADAESKRREFKILNFYILLRQCLPQNGWLMQALKSIAWRWAIDQETYFTNLFSNTASSFSPAIFLAHDLPMLPVARMHSQRCSAKLVYDSHELYSEQSFSAYVKTRWAQIEAKHIGACNSVITINPSIAGELEHRYGIPKAHVIYNAERSGAMIQRNRFFRKIFRLRDDDKIVLFQGGLSAGRKLETLIEAMAHVRLPFVHLVIMGDGKLKTSLSRKIKRLGVSSRVHLHPAVPQKALLAATAGADAGVIPYQATCLNNYYCTPNKLFEFIAAGIPILASDLPEIRRIIESHNIGMLADLSSAEKAARSIDHFFSDAQRFKFWQAQVEKARSVICWEREGEKLVAIFEALR